MWFVACILAIITFFAIRTSLRPRGVLHTIQTWMSWNVLRSEQERLDIMQREPICTLHDPFEEPLPAIRTQFGGLATVTYGWPSTGGLWVHDRCYGLELDFLGLDRFNESATQRDSDVAAEDAFCKRLELIGARFWDDEYDYNKQTVQFFKPRVLWTGWPAIVPDDGVWALWTEDYEGAEIGVSRIRNAFTMQERCKAIEMLGGQFFARWDDVMESERARSKGAAAADQGDA